MTILQNALLVPSDMVAATTERFATRAGERTATEHKIDEARSGHGSLLAVDTPDRVELRRRRVDVPAAEPDLLERVIEGNNLLAVAFLELGSRVAGSVARVHVRDQFRALGFGTGFLVSPRLLMTNHHVLEDAATARFSHVEFDFQNDLDGRPRATHVFDLLPDELFLTDVALDVAVVAVSPRSRETGADQRDLAAYGFNRLSREQGKILLGECINIVQHPEGQPKQLALQQNELVDRFDTFLHYRSDTSPGSSGSPLFNNQWEVLGLHHSGVPARDAQGRVLSVDGTVWDASMGPDRISWVANEGIRISSIIAWLEQQAAALAAPARALVDVVTAASPVETAPATVVVPAPRAAAPAAAPPPAPPRELTITVPVQVTVRLGDATVDGVTATVVASPAAVPAPALAAEAISIDPDYSTRAGYDAGFLGLCLPLPALTAEQRALVATSLQPVPGRDASMLDYHHFSVVMHRPRRIAWFTAVNIDGAITRDLRRESDRWIFDPRIPRDAQLGPDVYADNDFDRGHLVRRVDPAWGADDAVAKVANDDTFHFTNCSPQHRRFNQGDALWAGLEDHVLRSAKNERKRVTVLNGPVLRADDPFHRGAQIPLAFWKIMAFRTAEGRGSAAAFLISQRDLVAGMPLEASFVPETFQVPVRAIAEVTGLDLGPLVGLDALREEGQSPLEADTGVAARGVRLTTYGSIRL
jgi:endonuclease G